jgi:solute carrier family 25 phosphate transporter 23/24/25/41
VHTHFAMVKFGSTLSNHASRSPVPAEHYVDYKAMKKSIAGGVSQDEFQRMYAEQMQVVLDRLAVEPDTLRQDPEYVAMNRTALDKISKKYDKQRSATLRAEHRSQATSAFSQYFGQRASSGLAVFVAGGCAGVVSRSVTAPLNLVKMRLQTRSDQSYNMRQCCKEVMSEAGVRAFWRGNLANVLKVAPESAIRFGVYEQLKYSVLRIHGDDSQPAMMPVEKFICGSLSGGVAQAVVYPLDVAKTRMAVAECGVYTSVGQCLGKTIAGDGMRGLYRGLGPALASIMPVAGVDLAVFNTLKEQYIAWEQENRRRRHSLLQPHEVPETASAKPVQLPVSVSLLIGASAALAGGLIGYPLTVVRTRLITQNMVSGDLGRGSALGQYRYNGAVDALLQIWQHEGIRGLYRGQVPSLMKSLPAISIGYGTFEATRNVLDSFNAPDATVRAKSSADALRQS